MSNTPHIKFENSPADSLAESFSSTPGAMYPPLFNDTMDPAEVMTPQSYDDDSMFGGSMNGENSIAGTPAPEKKPVKKRKSWGQQLPEPKTCLPPRKRAKTEDEKEQRRVERVLRNRRAAQSSRERKRQEVEALEAEKRAIERRNQDLEMRLADMQAKNELLMRELAAFTGGVPVFRSSSAASTPGQSDQLRSAPNPVTFSQELFGSRDAQEQPISTQSIIKSEPTQTVNPASLSPEIRPVDESSNASSSDMTQHPAVSVGRTTALDGFANSNNFSHFSNLGNESLHQYEFGGYYDAPDSTDPNQQMFENGIASITDQFDLNYDHLVGNNDSVIDDFDLNEFLHHDDQPAPEIHSSDSLAEKTVNLQPQLGASSFGCDDGGHAVSV